MTIYTTVEINRMSDRYDTKYWTNKANAEKYLAETDKAWTNDYGVETHTCWFGNTFKTED